jgi:hypothetical protein
MIRSRGRAHGRECVDATDRQGRVSANQGGLTRRAQRQGRG